MATNNTVKLIKDIYTDYEQRMEKQQLQKNSNAMLDESLLRGIKCPQDISSDWSMHNYAKYFPHTKLIIGIRHPGNSAFVLFCCMNSCFEYEVSIIWMLI